MKKTERERGGGGGHVCRAKGEGTSVCTHITRRHRSCQLCMHFASHSSFKHSLTHTNSHTLPHTHTHTPTHILAALLVGNSLASLAKVTRDLANVIKKTNTKHKKYINLFEFSSHRVQLQQQHRGASGRIGAKKHLLSQQQHKFTFVIISRIRKRLPSAQLRCSGSAKSQSEKGGADPPSITNGRWLGLFVRAHTHAHTQLSTHPHTHWHTQL